MYKMTEFFKNVVTPNSTQQQESTSDVEVKDIQIDLASRTPVLSLSSNWTDLFESILGKKDAILTEPCDNAFDQLPTEIKVYILSFLTIKELGTIALVSKHWHSLSNLNDLWDAFPQGISMMGTTSKERIREAVQERFIKMAFFSSLPSVSNQEDGDDCLSQYHLHLLSMRTNANIHLRLTPEYIECGNDDGPNTRFLMKM